jgi:hypothetical protein
MIRRGPRPCRCSTSTWSATGTRRRTRLARSSETEIERNRGLTPAQLSMQLEGIDWWRPAKAEVTRHVREKLSCRAFDTMVPRRRSIARLPATALGPKARTPSDAGQRCRRRSPADPRFELPRITAIYPVLLGPGHGASQLRNRTAPPTAPSRIGPASLARPAPTITRKPKVVCTQ